MLLLLIKVTLPTRTRECGHTLANRASHVRIYRCTGGPASRGWYLHFPGRNGQVQVFEYGRLTVLFVRAPHDYRRRGTGHDRLLQMVFGGRSFVARHHRRGHVGRAISCPKQT